MFLVRGAGRELEEPEARDDLLRAVASSTGRQLPRPRRVARRAGALAAARGARQPASRRRAVEPLVDAGRRRRLPGAQLGPAPSLELRLSAHGVAFRRRPTYNVGPCRTSRRLARISFDLGVFARVARQRLRRTLVYLLLLVVVSVAATTTSWMLRLHEAVTLARAAPRRDPDHHHPQRPGRRPTWSSRGSSSSAATMHGLDVVAIIDTTGTRQSFGPNEVGVFLKAREVSSRAAEEERVVPLSRFPDTTVGPDIVRGWIEKAMRRAPFYLGGLPRRLVPVRQVDAGAAAGARRAHRRARDALRPALHRRASTR